MRLCQQARRLFIIKGAGQLVSVITHQRKFAFQRRASPITIRMPQRCGIEPIKGRGQTGQGFTYGLTHIRLPER